VESGEWRWGLACTVATAAVDKWSKHTENKDKTPAFHSFWTPAFAHG